MPLIIFCNSWRHSIQILHRAYYNSTTFIYKNLWIVEWSNFALCLRVLQIYMIRPMSMFTLTAIWGIGQTLCSFEHYLVITVFTDSRVIYAATGLSSLTRALQGVVEHGHTDPQTYSACHNIPPGCRPFVTIVTHNYWRSALSLRLDFPLVVCACNDWRGCAENARKKNGGLENAAPKCRGGIYRTGKCDTFPVLHFQSPHWRVARCLYTHTVHCALYYHSSPAHTPMPVLSMWSTWRLGISLDRWMPLMSDTVKRTKSKSAAAPSTQSPSSLSDAFDVGDAMTLPCTLSRDYNCDSTTVTIRLRYDNTTTRSTATEVIEIRLRFAFHSTAVRLRHDYDEKMTCSFFARVESRRMEAGARDTS